MLLLGFFFHSGELGNDTTDHRLSDWFDITKLNEIRNNERWDVLVSCISLH